MTTEHAYRFAEGLGLSRADYDLLIAEGWRASELAIAMPGELHSALRIIRGRKVEERKS